MGKTEIRRLRSEGEVFVALDDLVYLCNLTRDRHLITGKVERAETMEYFSLVLSTILITE